MIEWTTDGIERLAAEFADSRRLAARLWVDIEKLATRFVSLAPGGGADAAVAWHHFVLAVGNFKRQAPIHPALGRIDVANDGGDAPEVLRVPETFGTLRRDDPETWATLTLIDGVQTATATAILAALWPHHHFILDEWVLHIAGAMRAAQDDSYLDSTDVPYVAPTFGVYVEVRPAFLSLAEDFDVPLQHIERAAFLVSQRLKNDPSRTWRGYIDELNRRLAEA